MTSYLKDIEGFTKIVKDVLVKDGFIQRIHDPNEIYKHFNIFKNEEER
jgi:hypothetical protein